MNHTDLPPDSPLLRARIQTLADNSYAPYTQKILAASLPVVEEEHSHFMATVTKDSVTGAANYFSFGAMARSNDEACISIAEHEAVHYDQSLNPFSCTPFSTRIQDLYKYVLVSEMDAYSEQGIKTIEDVRSGRLNEDNFRNLYKHVEGATQIFTMCYFQKDIGGDPAAVWNQLKRVKNDSKRGDPLAARANFFWAMARIPDMKQTYIQQAIMNQFTVLDSLDKKTADRDALQKKCPYPLFSKKFGIDEAVALTERNGKSPIAAMGNQKRSDFWKNTCSLVLQDKQYLEVFKHKAAHYTNG